MTSKVGGAKSAPVGARRDEGTMAVYDLYANPPDSLPYTLSTVFAFLDYHGKYTTYRGVIDERSN